MQRFEGQVQLVLYPFALSPTSEVATQAAWCAGEQGKFWEFHDKVYGGDSDSSAATMTRYAKEVAIKDLPAFDACVKARKYQAQVQRDVAEGVKLGINGTPGFFINGRLLSGAQPLEVFTSIIDAELQNAK